MCSKEMRILSLGEGPAAISTLHESIGEQADGEADRGDKCYTKLIYDRLYEAMDWIDELDGSYQQIYGNSIVSRKWNAKAKQSAMKGSRPGAAASHPSPN